MNNVLLIGIILIVVGGVAGGLVANNYLSDQSQGDGLNFNSDNGFGKNGFNNNKDSKTQNNNLNMNTKITVINVALVEAWYQYIEVINVEINNINFNSLNDEFINIGGHMFSIPNGNTMSSGYASSNGDFYSSEIYQTNDGTSFGIMVIKNPKGTAEELANELAKEKNLQITKDTVSKIASSGSIDIYKFESEGITHYVYNDGNDIVIIVMNHENDYLFMYMTNSSTTGTIDESNPYYSIDSTDTSNDVEYQIEEDNTSQDSSYEDNSYENSYYYDEDYINEGYY